MFEPVVHMIVGDVRVTVRVQGQGGEAARASAGVHGLGDPVCTIQGCVAQPVVEIVKVGNVGRAAGVEGQRGVHLPFAEGGDRLGEPGGSVKVGIHQLVGALGIVADVRLVRGVQGQGGVHPAISEAVHPGDDPGTVELRIVNGVGQRVIVADARVQVIGQGQRDMPAHAERVGGFIVPVAIVIGVAQPLAAGDVQVGDVGIVGSVDRQRREAAGIVGKVVHRLGDPAGAGELGVAELADAVGKVLVANTRVSGGVQGQGRVQANVTQAVDGFGEPGSAVEGCVSQVAVTLIVVASMEGSIVADGQRAVASGSRGVVHSFDGPVGITRGGGRGR